MFIKEIHTVFTASKFQAETLFICEEDLQWIVSAKLDKGSISNASFFFQDRDLKRCNFVIRVVLS